MLGEFREVFIALHRQRISSRAALSRRRRDRETHAAAPRLQRDLGQPGDSLDRRRRRPFQKTRPRCRGHPRQQHHRVASAARRRSGGRAIGHRCLRQRQSERRRHAFSRRHPRQAALQLHRQRQNQNAAGFERQTGRRHPLRRHPRCPGARDAENVEPRSGHRCARWCN